MQNVILTQFSAIEFQEMIREELHNYFNSFQPKPQNQNNNLDNLDSLEEFGRGVAYAEKIIKKKPSTIYGMIARNELPHSKRGNSLYFRKSELIAWLNDGKRKTNAELQAQ